MFYFSFLEKVRNLYNYKYNNIMVFFNNNFKCRFINTNNNGWTLVQQHSDKTL